MWPVEYFPERTVKKEFDSVVVQQTFENRYPSLYPSNIINMTFNGYNEGLDI